MSVQKSCVVNIGRVGGSRYYVAARRSRYWRPGSDYASLITANVSGRLSDGDFVVVSEKAISIAKGRIVDEAQVKPGLTAKIIARFWMRWIWGYPLGRLCHMSQSTRSRLRHYPVKEGAAHKQLCLKHAGILQSLRHGSEGGVDVSNLPYSYAALPLSNPQVEAEHIRERISRETGRRVSVMIVDTDKTYRLGSRNYTPLPRAVPGITAGGGLLIYVVCRVFRCRRRSTLLGSAGENLGVETLLDIAETANRARGVGAGRTPWHMAERFNVELTRVTWEMLEQVAHYPVVIVKRLS
ncbi:MAG: coenzyme F420-0:L-glutamate ligase [Thaumarchaeota archaeon]|nr:coenzyme F420-0:L-glutamate ligase [Nitrososphaerota archaeon]MCL5318707.1 coenzyme F420-0:L-glutamate ligase [Nitrososphaerota archaeon]